MSITGLKSLCEQCYTRQLLIVGNGERLTSLFSGFAVGSQSLNLPHEKRFSQA